MKSLLVILGAALLGCATAAHADSLPLFDTGARPAPADWRKVAAQFPKAPP